METLPAGDIYFAREITLTQTKLPAPASTPHPVPETKIKCAVAENRKPTSPLLVRKSPRATPKKVYRENPKFPKTFSPSRKARANTDKEKKQTTSPPHNKTELVPETKGTVQRRTHAPQKVRRAHARTAKLERSPAWASRNRRSRLNLF